MPGRLHFTPGGKLFFWTGQIGAPEGFDEEGNPLFEDTGLVMTTERCIGCLCCGNDELGYTSCRFNRNSKITGYVFRNYLGGVLANSFIGTRDFPKRPRGGGSATGPAGARATVQNCCFCQEYLYTTYNVDGGVVDQRIVAGAGTGFGFCYTLSGRPGYEAVYPGGWWDGNEAGATTACTGGEPPYVTGVPCFTPPCRTGTFFACGVCKGLIVIRYFYNCPPAGAPPSSGQTSYADVYFTVENPDCDEWNEGETYIEMDFATRGNSTLTGESYARGGQNTGAQPWLLFRGATQSTAQYHSADQSLFVSGSRVSTVSSPDDNYTDLLVNLPTAADLEFYVWETATGTLDLELTSNGVSKWDSPTASLTAETWTKVTVSLDAGQNYLKFTSAHDGSNAATDGHYLDTMKIILA